MHIKTERNTFYVYIVTDKERKRLELGTTGDLAYRLAKLEANIDDKASECSLLIYWEALDDAIKAVARSEEIARWSRKRKAALIEQANPEWKPFNEEIKLNKHSLITSD